MKSACKSKSALKIAQNFQGPYKFNAARKITNLRQVICPQFQVNYNSIPNLQKQFEIDNNMINQQIAIKKSLEEERQIKQRQKNKHYRNKAGIYVDPQIQFQLKEYNKLIYERETQKNPSNLIKKQHIPFNDENYSWMQYMSQKTKQLNQIQIGLKKLQSTFAILENLTFNNLNKIDPEGTKNTLSINFQKTKTNLLLIDAYMQDQSFQGQQIFNANKNKLNQLITIIQSVQQKQKLDFQWQNKIKKIDDQTSFLQKTIEQNKNKASNDKFQSNISKLQLTNILFRYGVQVTIANLNKNDYWDLNRAKWDRNSKSISLIDLKVFVLSTLYPVCLSIFQDFSAQSKIYKIMFGLDKYFSKQEIQASLITLKSRIQNYYKKKFNTLQLCLTSSCKIKKKKIIFIGSESKFAQVTTHLINQLRFFNNGLLAIYDAKLQMTDQFYYQTPFKCGKITIQFIYEKISVNTTIDVLFCPFNEIKKIYIDIARKKTARYQPVIVWFEIPRLMPLQMLPEAKQINLMLNKCKSFNPEMDKKDYHK